MNEFLISFFGWFCAGFFGIELLKVGLCRHDGIRRDLVAEMKYNDVECLVCVQCGQRWQGRYVAQKLPARKGKR